MHNLINTYIFI